MGVYIRKAKRVIIAHAYRIGTLPLFSNSGVCYCRVGSTQHSILLNIYGHWISRPDLRSYGDADSELRNDAVILKFCNMQPARHVVMHTKDMFGIQALQTVHGRAVESYRFHAPTRRLGSERPTQSKRKKTASLKDLRFIFMRNFCENPKNCSACFWRKRRDSNPSQPESQRTAA